MPDNKWIFDSVVLSSFFLSGAENIIENRYKKRGIVTWQVFDEIQAGIPGYPELHVIEDFISRNVLELVSLSLKENTHYLELTNSLGKGEASCIALAKKHNFIVATDDRAARRVCSQNGIRMTGTIGILKSQYLDGKIQLEKADSILAAMVKAGFYSPVSSISDIV